MNTIVDGNAHAYGACLSSDLLKLPFYFGDNLNPPSAPPLVWEAVSVVHSPW